MTNNTEVLTLTGFLLARIAEDEADANVNLRGARGGVLEPAWGANAERVLAECEAKRRIVALHEDSVAEDYDLDPGDNEGGWVVDGQLRVLAAALGALAAVYADHPDCREEWRP